MRDNPNAATGLALLLLAAIAGGAYYLLVMRHPTPPPPEAQPKAPTTWQTLTPRPGQVGTEASDAPRVPAGTSKGRTDTPIKCFDPEVGEFWTNASTCAGADLNNHLSHPDSQAATSTATANANAGANTKGNTAANAQASAAAQVKADRDKYMGMGYMTPEEEAVKSRADDNN